MTFSDCPNLCECKWKSGKESVLCLKANLTGIPVKLDAGTQVLDLRQNEISIVADDAFNRANLLNLQKLFLARCRLKIIERFAFRMLKNLVELDLSYNALTSIPSDAFESASELRELYLVGNPIQRVSAEAFAKLPQLVRLELSNCKIQSIDVRAFVGLESTLEWLKLDGNRLIDIRAGALMSLQNLHGLELAGNPWNCTCNLRPLREWLLRENIPYDIPPICRFPMRLASKSWDKIELDEFACIPHILAPDVRAHGVEGRNITMSCMVGGVPEPSVRWIVRNRVIANLTNGNSMQPTAQGRKMYVAQLQQNASNLTILTAEVQDAGTYICTAENKAGKVEASVTLAVSRKPPDAMLNVKIVLASIITVVLFILTTSLAVVCICTVRKRRKLMRWQTPARSESYEKIELSTKPNHFGDRGNGKSPRSIDRSVFMKPFGDNAISVVGQNRRNGDYRNVPTDDEGTDGYEENAESSNATISNIKIDNFSSWAEPSVTVKTASTATNRGATKKIDNKRQTKFQGKAERKTSKFDETDLHIPRLIDYT